MIILSVILLAVSSAHGAYQRCGGKLTATKGIIQSPNFPGPFETPVFCEWVIQAPPKLKIVLYLTQYYLKGYFHVYEYEHYTNKNDYISERKLATVNCEDEIWSIVAHRPFMVIRFAVQEMGNIHLRVLDHLIDVYGFNITYELVNKHEMDSKWTCSAFDCSYLGHCYATADFSEYQCHCFPNFSGTECQFGPHCNPMINKNMCQNNGSCRYLFGDYVNICECPAEFYGSMCEQKIDGAHPGACAVLDCEQTCLATSSSKPVCACNHGYTLSTDNRSCIHIDQHKYNIRISLMNRTAVLTERETQTIQQKFIRLFQQRGVLSLKNVTVIQTDKNHIDIQFLIETTERPLFDYSLSDVLTNLGSLEVDTDNIYVTLVPELYLLSTTLRVDTGSGLAAIEDKGMTLSCVARGPKNTTFKWFKDGYLLDLSLFKDRAQETLIPSSRDDILRSVITFDKVSPLDRGTFTCEVTDGNSWENKSLSVSVLTIPLVDLYPLSLSVVEGESASIICMSPEDTAKNFTYTWYSNGRVIHHGRKDKIVEDLFPTGTRLFVPRTNRSENFSCTVENKAGSFTLMSNVFLQKASTNMSCSQGYHKQVLWKKTAGNHFDKERCPSETGGYATRKCLCTGDTCSWAEPNFAKCQSVYLVYEVYDKLELLRLGYKQTTIKYVYNRLCQFIFERSSKNLYSGDVELAASILHELLKHLEQLSYTREQFTLKSLIGIMDVMLQAANQSTWEEKQDMKAAPYFLRICGIIAQELISILEYESGTNITTSTLDVNVLSLPTESEKRNSSDEMKFLEESGEEFTVKALSFTNKVIYSMLEAKEKRPSIGDKMPISQVHSVFPFEDNNLPKNLIVNIPITHHNQFSPSSEDQIVCVSWEFDRSDLQFGRWVSNDCTVVSSKSDRTICSCKLPGHFMVITTPRNITMLPLTKEYDSFVPLVLACIFNIIILSCAMLVYIYRKMWLLGDDYPIHFSFKLSFVIKCITFLICLKNDSHEILYFCGHLVVYFCFMAAYSSLFAVSVQIFIVTSKRKSKNNLKKLICICYGVPAVITLIFGIASNIHPKGNCCTSLCWISHSHWHFYGFIVPIIAFDIAVLSMLIIALRSRLKQKENSEDTSSSFNVTCLKTLSILVILNAISYLSVFIQAGGTHYVVSYSVLSCLLGLLLILTRCITNAKLISWKRKSSFQDETVTKNPTDRIQSNSSFRAYMRPELARQSPPERKGASKYYAHVNRTKFTDERKRQLSNLLGSSQAAEHQHADHERWMPHNDNGASDSGIFGSENERFLNCDTDSNDHVRSGNRIIVADVHVPNMQNGFVRHGLVPFPELIQRQACKEPLLDSSWHNHRGPTPKVTYIIDSKEDLVIAESGESTVQLLQRKHDDQSDSHDSDVN